MARPAPRRKQDRVDPDVVAGPDEPGRHSFGGSDDAPQPVSIQREGKLGSGFSPLHFNEDDSAAPPGDKVDLAARGLDPLRQHMPALEPQIPRGQALPAPSAPFGRFPLHFSSIARA